MKRTKPVSKKLFIQPLELPARAQIGDVTTLAIGEECAKCGDDGGPITTLAIGEESLKA
ncbi:MAG TPA: hypothetical protein HPP77_09785 [Candidatus Hydrogenedentes bacterium]|nr:hypothetical protein [Candidatus Hydrogenedentota bacterium]HIJ74808.1 hypothetical protein [Candidatus Hydrogenedentota bacterium]